MGRQKSTVYQCDNPECREKFFEAEDVFNIKGLEDGDEGEIVGESMLCPTCFLKFAFVDRDILDPIVDFSEVIKDEMALQEEKENDEDEMDIDNLMSENEKGEDWND